MPVSDATNSSKGKAKAKTKATNRQYGDLDGDLNNESNASSSGLPGADGEDGEDDYGYNYDARTQQRLRIPLRQAWKSYLITTLLAFTTLLLGLGLMVLVIADSYAAPALHRLNRLLQDDSESASRVQFLNNALILGKPEGVWIDGVERADSGSESEYGLEINATVAIRVGVDTDYVLGLQDVQLEDNWLRRTWVKTVRWGASTLGAVTVRVDQLEVLTDRSQGYRNETMVTIRPLSLIPVSLCPGFRTHNTSHSFPFDPRINAGYCDLPLLHLSFSLYPTDDATTLIGFLERGWKEGSMNILTNVSGVSVIGGAPPKSDDPASHPTLGENPRWWQFSKWRRWIHVFRPSIETKVQLEVYPLKFPNMPPLEPGSELPDIMDLLVLESFEISTSTSFRDGLSPLSIIPSVTDNLIMNHLQHILSTHDHDTIFESESVGHSYTSDRRKIVLLAQASLMHPFGALAPLIDLGIQIPPIPFIVSLPIPPHEGGGENSSLSPRIPISILSQSSASVPVVKVFSSPSFNETHVQLPLWGYVLPLALHSISGMESGLPSTSNLISSSAFTSITTDSDFVAALSTFIRSYLTYKPSLIYLTTPFYPNLQVAANFPPPKDKLQIIHDVKLEDMWIKPGGFFSASVTGIGVDAMEMSADDKEGKMHDMYPVTDPDTTETIMVEDPSMWSSLALEVLASATVHARVVLPRGFDVDLEVVRLWVDALIFDGDVPTEDEDEGSGLEDESDIPEMKYSTEDPTLPTPFPLPTPLPPRAFARITPRTWLNATSSLTQPGEGTDEEHRDPDEDENNDEREGKSIYVTAKAVDVPLQMLPGRQGDLRRFVTKVLFSSEPVIAGIKGVVAVAIKIPGLTYQTGLKSPVDDSPHDSGYLRASTSPSLPTATSKLDPFSSNLDGQRKSEPRIEGSELILTDLPFEGNVPIGKSSIWMRHYGRL